MNTREQLEDLLRRGRAGDQRAVDDLRYFLFTAIGLVRDEVIYDMIECRLRHMPDQTVTPK